MGSQYVLATNDPHETIAVKFELEMKYIRHNDCKHTTSRGNPSHLS